MPRVVIAPDKFRGTADAGAVAAAMGRAAASLGWDATILPMSDGGEGMLDVVEDMVAIIVYYHLIIVIR